MTDDKSKSQIKREAKALQELGAQLTKLSPNELAHIALPEDVLEAIIHIRKINSHVARKRHLQWIGRLMRKLDDGDITLIHNRYYELKNHTQLKTDQFHLIEEWRNRLLSDDKDALTEFIQQYPCDNTQQLRQLIRQAQAERDHHKNQGAGKALFRLIRELMQ